MGASAGPARLILAALLIGVSSVTGPKCERSTDPVDGLLLKTRSQFNLGDTLTLAVNESAENAPSRTVIRFDSVLGDSRCPRDVMCFWEGNAEVAFEMEEPGGRHVFSLNTYRGFARDTVLAGLTVGLIDVLPYPERSGQRPDPRDYRVVLTVR